MPTLKQRQRPIFLGPRAAELLAELAEELKTTEQALLRQAVENLLAMHGVEQSNTIEAMRETAKECRARVRKIEHKHADDPETHRACAEANVFLTALLAALGERKTPSKIK
jgi:hypothetical protein